jgi:hypothetical protein
LERVKRPRVSIHDNDGQRLLWETRAFLESEHWQAAVTLGWDRVELFGINLYAPAHVEYQGLVTSLALSGIPTGKIVEITEDEALIQHRPGLTLTYRRFMPAMETAVVWWECPELIGSEECL